MNVTTWIIKHGDDKYYYAGNFGPDAKFTIDKALAYRWPSQADALSVAVKIPRSKVEKF